MSEVEKKLSIVTEITPNPSTLKFDLGIQILPQGSLDFPDRELSSSCLLAQKLFKLEEVEAVFFGKTFVTITKPKGVSWAGLMPKVTEALEEHYALGLPFLEEALTGRPVSKPSTSREEDDEISQKIREILDNEIRPAVAMDGGDIVLEGFKDGVVSLYLQGACSGCPSSSMTLKMGIENRLKESIPEVLEVVQVPYL